MLKKAQRLTRKEFEHFFAVGKRLHSPFFQVIYHESPHMHGSAVVGKKVAKKAVDRNTLRRRIYGILYPYLKTNTVPQTVIVVAKVGARTLPRKQFTMELKSLLERLFTA